MKKTLAIILASLFLGASVAVAATVTCTVQTVKNGIITLDCGKKANRIKEGVKVKVRTATKRKAVEGC